MSVILKTPNDEVVLYCKGADSIIEKRLKTKEYLSNFFSKYILWKKLVKYLRKPETHWPSMQIKG